MTDRPAADKYESPCHNVHLTDSAKSPLRLQDLFLGMLVVVLASCLAGLYLTTGSERPGNGRNGSASPVRSMIDDRLLQTARRMVPFADLPVDQDLAREALRLSDHELDQAFATALREAELPADPASVPQGAAKNAAERLSETKAKVAADHERMAELIKKGASDELELANAQLALDEDDVEDAQQDLARQGGDRHDRLERARAEHEAAQQGAPPAFRSATLPPLDTLQEQARYWFQLGSQTTTLMAAEREANYKASGLERQHSGLESKAAAGSQQSPDDEEDTAAMVAQLRRLSDQKKTLAELDKRIQDATQLGEVYQRWITQVEGRRRDALHLIFGSLSEIAGIVIIAMLIYRALVFVTRSQDRARQHRVRVIGAIAAEFTALAAVLLIVFGPPTQLSTMIGLATAGLTVVLKDFIVGFIGWFVLLGRNGVRIGDWVEINGVGGEVIEIGILKTILLEMGAWTGKGHPTGRRVAFSNGYAIEGHYFNFSTAGQWLWDELQVTVPGGQDPYQVAEHIRAAVEKETETDAVEAAQDWERVTHQYRVGAFSAKPAVDLRPGLTGLEVSVRYITRAPRRYEVKSRLFQTIVALLHTPAGNLATASSLPGAASSH